MTSLKKKLEQNDPDLKKLNDLMEKLFTHLSNGGKAINFKTTTIDEQININELKFTYF